VLALCGELVSVIYLSGCIRDIRHKRLGFMFTPQMGNVIPNDVTWGADNGRFGSPEKYSDTGYLTWLASKDPARCLFATAPDVVGDHQATVELSVPMLPRIRALGYKPAFVAQDGFDSKSTPWDLFDVLFIGGTTEFKLSCGDAIREAKRRGKWVHMGRVNSYTRIRVATAMGCDSSDGTYLKFGPDINAPKLLGWLDKLEREPMLGAA
jgi:hypothetical protein